VGDVMDCVVVYVWEGRKRQWWAVWTLERDGGPLEGRAHRPTRDTVRCLMATGQQDSSAPSQSANSESLRRGRPQELS